MRAWLLLAGVFLLPGCGREDQAAAFPDHKAPLADISIVDRHLPEDRVDAAPTASRSAPVPVASPPSSESRYHAMGTEPFWSVLAKGSTVTLERPDKAPAHFAISRTDDGRVIRYLGDGFVMMVTEGPCSDGMSDAVWADRVSIAFGEGTLKGCGGAREDF